MSENPTVLKILVSERITFARLGLVQKGSLDVVGADGGGGSGAHSRASAGSPLAVPELRRLPALLPCALQEGLN